MGAQTKFNFKLEARKRDSALDLFEVHRAELLAAAREVALELAAANEQVTAPEVLEVLRERGHADSLEKVDRRFMGAVFRSGKGWERVGFANRGSHRQPISVWKRASKAVSNG